MLKIRGIWQITKSVIRFSEILCDDRHSKVSKNVFFFVVFYDYIIQRTSLDFIEYKIDMSYIYWFIVLFFLIVLMFKSGVHCDSSPCF